jgi:hypothetical protein
VQQLPEAVATCVDAALAELEEPRQIALMKVRAQRSSHTIVLSGSRMPGQLRRSANLKRNPKPAWAPGAALAELQEPRQIGPRDDVRTRGLPHP